MNDITPKPDLSIDRRVFGVRNSTEKDFDSRNQTAIQETLAEIDRIVFFEMTYLLKGVAISTPSRLEAYSLLGKSLEILISSFLMVRQRAHIEAWTLGRASLESALAALDISRNSSAYASYTKGKYKSSEVVGKVKKDVPYVGKFYGVFSNLCVHVSAAAYGPRLRTHEGKTHRMVEIQWQCRKAEGQQDRRFLTIIKIIANVILRVYELVWCKKWAGHEGWLTLAGTNLRIGGILAESLLHKHYKELISLVQA